MSIADDAVRVKDVCNHFLTYQLQKVEAAGISTRWFEDCRLLVNSFATFVVANTLDTSALPSYEAGTLK